MDRSPCPAPSALETLVIMASSYALRPRLDRPASTDIQEHGVAPNDASHADICQQFATPKRDEALSRTWLFATAARRTIALLDLIFCDISSFWPLADFTLLLSRAYLSLMHACVDLSLVAGAARAAEAAEGGASARSAAGHAAAIAAASVLAIAGSTAVAERAARHRTLTALANALPLRVKPRCVVARRRASSAR